MRQELPPCPGLVAGGALDQGVCHGAGRLQQGAGCRLICAVLRGVEQDVPYACGAAAAAVAVPETRAKPLRDTGGKDPNAGIVAAVG